VISFLNIELSIAIVTRNRPVSLARALKSLEQQTVPPFEVIISDDSKDEEIIRENKMLAKASGAKYISGPQKGLYANRNFAAKNCSGTHIRTMDDDHELPTDHIEQCLIALMNFPSSIWIIGEFYPNEDKTKIPPCPGQIHPRGFSVTPPDNQNCYAIACGATIYPRKVIEDNLLNVEYYKFGIVYLEYGMRLYSRGYNIRFMNSTYIIHNMDDRSYSDIASLVEARIFTMIIFSFFYFPTLKNKITTIFSVIRFFFKYYFQINFFNSYVNLKKNLKNYYRDFY
jgi:glycosyltransferase involved in cell wall biosynthesis